MAFARINGIVIHHASFGRADAPAVVLVNSLGTDFRIWQQVWPALAEVARVIAYDKRGHGLTDAPPAPYRIDDHVGDLVGLLDHLAIDRAVLVGVSVGGLIAQAVACRAPERVAGLVLADTAARVGSVESWGQRIAAVEAGGLGSIADAVMERWFTPAYRTAEPAALAGWRNMLTRIPAHGYNGVCATLRDTDLTAEVGGIAVPTLWLVGDQDLATPPDLVESSSRLVPGARFSVIDACGHLPCIEQPERTAALVLGLLTEVGHGR